MWGQNQFILDTINKTAVQLYIKNIMPVCQTINIVRCIIFTSVINFPKTTQLVRARQGNKSSALGNIKVTYLANIYKVHAICVPFIPINVCQLVGKYQTLKLRVSLHFFVGISLRIQRDRFKMQ